MNSYVNQYIKSGEFVDSKAREEILNIVYSVRTKFEVAVSALQSTIHRIDYESLKTPLEIYERTLDLILASSAEETLKDWTIPEKLANKSIPLKGIELINEFNRLNTPGRQFDAAQPIIYSDLFSVELYRLELFKKLIEDYVERDELIQQRDLIKLDRDFIVREYNQILNSAIWRKTKFVRLMVAKLRQVK